MASHDAAAFSRPPRAAAPRSATASDNGLRAQVLWGGMGFVLGVVVWHFVGFWSFMTTLVHRGPEPSASSASVIAAGDRQARLAGKPARALDGVERTSTAAANPMPCTALVLDRDARSTTAADCASSPEMQGASSVAPRGDRVVDPWSRDPGWSATVDTRVTSAD
jgi:hypothetical protein